MDIVPHKLENREGNCRQCDNVALQVGCGEARARARERRKLHAAAYGARKTVFRALRRGSRYQQPGRGANRARFSVQCELSWGARNERRRNGRVIVTSRDKKVVQVVTWARWILRLITDLHPLVLSVDGCDFRTVLQGVKHTGFLEWAVFHRRILYDDYG